MRTAQIPVAMAAAATRFLILPTGLEADLGRTLGEYTVARTIVRFGLGQSVNNSVPAGLVTMGCTIVGRVAAAAGIASLPNPAAQPHADWYWFWGGMPGKPNREGAAGVFFVEYENWMYDVHSMRKVAESEELPVWVCANGMDVTVNVWVSIDTLILRS